MLKIAAASLAGSVIGTALFVGVLVVGSKIQEKRENKSTEV